MDKGISCIMQFVIGALLLFFCIMLCGAMVSYIIEDGQQKNYREELRQVRGTIEAYTIGRDEDNIDELPPVLQTAVASESNDNNSTNREITNQPSSPPREYNNVNVSFDVESDFLRFRIKSIYDLGEVLRIIFVITDINELGAIINFAPKTEANNIYLLADDGVRINSQNMGGAFVNGARLGNQFSDGVNYDERAEGWVEFTDPNQSSFELCYISIRVPSETICTTVSLTNQTVSNSNSTQTTTQNNATRTPRPTVSTPSTTSLGEYCNRGIVRQPLNLRQTPNYTDDDGNIIYDEIKALLPTNTEVYVRHCVRIMEDGIPWVEVETTVDGTFFRGWVSSDSNYLSLDFELEG